MLKAVPIPGPNTSETMSAITPAISPIFHQMPSSLLDVALISILVSWICFLRS